MPSLEGCHEGEPGLYTVALAWCLVCNTCLIYVSRYVLLVCFYIWERGGNP